MHENVGLRTEMLAQPGPLAARGICCACQHSFLCRVPRCGRAMPASVLQATATQPAWRCCWPPPPQSMGGTASGNKHPCCIRVASVLHPCCIRVASMLHPCCTPHVGRMLHPCHIATTVVSWVAALLAHGVAGHLGPYSYGPI